MFRPIKQLLLVLLISCITSGRRHHHAHLHLPGQMQVQVPVPGQSNPQAGNSIDVHHLTTSNHIQVSGNPGGGSASISGSSHAQLTVINAPQGADSAGDFNGYTKHHPGRHVCSHQKNIQRSVKTVQAYCKPAYRQYTTQCHDKEGEVCKGVRLVYETAYRDIVKPKFTKETLYACCPGWIQITKVSHGCNKPLCTKPCQNGGTCVRPDTCTCGTGYKGSQCEVDINECSELKPCDQMCFNTPGSFFCKCRDGFKLQPDGQSCRRNDNETPAFEAKDLEFEFINARITKIEKMMETTRYSENLTPNELSHKVEYAIKNIAAMNRRIEDVEKKQREITDYKNSLRLNGIHTKRIESQKPERVNRHGCRPHGNRICA